jgi:PLP dependent protein
MQLTYDEFSDRVAKITSQIEAACTQAGRDPAEVELLVVTKTHPATAAEYAARYGLRAVGENRVQEAVPKRAECKASIAWELIGHLQSNKAKLAAEHFDRVQSVDSPKLANHLARAAAALGKKLPILLQINAGNDPAKFGADPERAAALLETSLSHDSLQVDGLMTIAPLSEDADVSRRTFENLRTIRDTLASQFSRPLPVLSMGMSGDLEIAIASGSTQVRVGTALFGHREKI